MSEAQPVSAHDQSPIDDVIAEQKLIAIVGTDRRDVTLQIGRPYIDGEGVSRCPVAIWGLDGRLADFVGGSTFNAMNMACGVLGRRLLDYSASGDVTFYLQGSEDEGALSAKFITMTLFGRVMVMHSRKTKLGQSTETHK